MSYGGNDSDIRWWERPVYVAVTLFLLLVGLLLLFWDVTRAVLKRKNIAYSLSALLLALLFWAGYVYLAYTRTLDLGDRVVTVMIVPGDSFASVADELVSRGVVSSRVMLALPARLRGIDKRLIVGRYDFVGKNSCRSVLDRLKKGDFLRIRVTIPEGVSIWKTAAIVAEELPLDSTALVALNEDSAFLSQLGLPCLEGYLFPETYFFPWGATVDDVIREMVTMFRSETDTVWPGSPPLGLSRHDIIILASIVEAEALLDSERPLVASVYLNRLRIDMKLDADPTVVYGLGGLDRPLLKRDLAEDTPYNTYLHKGLPPTPINSPGLASLKATLRSAKTDYFYFVADDRGGHVFSRTNAEHNRAKQEIRVGRRN